MQLVGPSGGWSAHLDRNDFNLDLAESGQGAVFRFRLADNHHGGRIGLNTSNGHIGFALFGNDIYPDYNLGSTDVASDSLGIEQMPNVWYRAQLAVDQEGRPSWRLWREDAPDDLTQQINLTLEVSEVMDYFEGKKLRAEIWTGSTTASTSILYLADYTEGPVYTTQYTYDLQDNLTMVTDTLGYTTVITYDTLSRKTAMTDPDMGTWHYDYDVSGNLVRQIDGNGDRLCFYYDDFNRLEAKYHEGASTSDCPTSGSDTLLAAYSYYNSGPGASQVYTISGNINTPGAYLDTFTYDYRSRVEEQSRVINTRAYTMSVTQFDLHDRPTATAYDYPGSSHDETVEMGYDHLFADSLQIDLGTPAVSLVSSTIHNQRGQVQQINRPHPLPDTLYFYYKAAPSHPGIGFVDGNYRLQSIRIGSLSRISYHYDAVGNVQQIYDATRLDIQNFNYDHLNRLTAAEGHHVSICPDLIPCYNHAYSYDGIGNLTDVNRDGQDNVYEYETWHDDCNEPTQPMPHAVKQIGSDYYCYDGNGNMTERHDQSGTYTQTFDVENRLVVVTNTASSEVTAFYYDASGGRLLTIEPDGTEIYYPFSGYEEEITDTTTIQRSTYFLAGIAIATRISGDPDTSQNGLFFIYSDHLGSNSLMTDDTGAVVPDSLSRYLPFGDWRTQPSADLTDIGFTGHKSNNVGGNDIGLIYMQARYYLPGVNRFLSADSIVPDPTDPQSYNRYAYVLNSPIQLLDPSGHCGGNRYNIGWTPNTTEENECWEYLESEFCTNSSSGADICNGNGWEQWIYYNNLGYFSGDWTKEELVLLNNAISGVISALNSAGIDWFDTSLETVLFVRTNHPQIPINKADGWNNTLTNNIWLADNGMIYQTIVHELGHGIDHLPGLNDLHDRYDRASGNCGLICNSHAADGYYYRNYGRGGSFDNGFGRQLETWADAFSAWVYSKSHDGQSPSAWVRNGLTLTDDDWSKMFQAVETALSEAYSP